MSCYGPILNLFVGRAEYTERTEANPFKTEIGIRKLKTETFCAPSELCERSISMTVNSYFACDSTNCYVDDLNGALAMNNQIILLAKMNNRNVHAI